MKKADIESLSLDRLWDLREKIAAVLAARLVAKKTVLDDRLRRLNGHAQAGQFRKARRPYPEVRPKYRNPNRPSETWAGRGKRPRWLTAALESGERLDVFQI